jgi:tetratricopeptide (TPR) repeat protein
MNARSSASWLLLLLAHSAFFLTCATRKKPDLDPLLAQSRKYFETGEFEKAMESYSAALREYPQEKALSREYAKTLEAMKRQADQAAAGADYAPAGKAYFLLWKNYASYDRLTEAPSFSRGDLEEGLKKCRTRLTQLGLEQYREGNLAEAVSIWKEILLFDPDNVEIKKAVDTATQQLEKIKKEKGI